MAGDSEAVTGSAGVVQRVEEERHEPLGVETVGSGRAANERVDEIGIAASPVGARGGAAEPAFLLEEVEKYEAAEEFLDEVPHGLERAIASFVI